MRAMADRGSAAAARDSVAVRGAVVRRDDPDALVAEIDRTRESLAAAIDALADRVSPAKNAARLRARVQEQAARPEVRLAAAAAGLVLVSVAVYRVVRRK
jgi:uncharacterized protein DUF3618